MTEAGLLAVTESFTDRTIVVVGDVITDEYLIGKPRRISREAPVIILKFAERDVRLGGAANAAHNVAALGARVVPVGVIGRDGAGEALLALFQRAGITTHGLVVEAGRMTPMKTRIMAGGYPATRQQVVRLDREPSTELMPATEDALMELLSTLAARADAILVSDYGYGTVAPRVFEHVQSIARSRGAIVTVDSRYELPRFSGVTAATPNEAELGDLTGHPVDDERAVEKAGRQLLERLHANMLLVTRGAIVTVDSRYELPRFCGVTAATPNEAELGDLTGHPVDDERAVEKAGRQLLERLNAGMLLVTRGSQGLALLERDGGASFIPIFGTDEIADVTGAGDTVISTFTAALAGGASPIDAATLANVAGGIVVMKRGTATVSPAELTQALGGG